MLAGPVHQHTIGEGKWDVADIVSPESGQGGKEQGVRMTLSMGAGEKCGYPRVLESGRMPGPDGVAGVAFSVNAKALRPGLRNQIEV